jgi:hypothetical protein
MRKFRDKFLKKFYQVTIDSLKDAWYKQVFCSRSEHRKGFCAFRVGLISFQQTEVQGW